MKRLNDPKNVGCELMVTIEDTSDIECNKNLISNFCEKLVYARSSCTNEWRVN